jgi:hypothetical protein
MDAIIDFLFWKTESVTPAYGLFHIISLVLVVTACVFAGIWGGRLSDKNLRKLLFGLWIVLVIGEIYREFIFGADITDATINYTYQWYLFPFQLCSSPLYAFPFVIFLPEGKLRDGFMAFLATFCFFGGASVMVYPGDVLTRVVLSNVQSMLHHGVQAIIGILMVSVNLKKLGIKFYLKGAYVFGGFLGMAMLLNLTVGPAIIANFENQAFNMFYISPYFNCTLPILSSIQAGGAPYPVVLLLYVSAFVLVAAIIAAAEYFISKALVKNKKAEIIA